MLHIELIILHCLQSIKNERTIYSIFHLLKGKKSSQTIQDAHLFSLKPFFGILEPMTRELFDRKIAAMLQNNLIIDCGGQRFVPALLGESLLQNNRLPIFINGWDYHQITGPVWERLTLLVQVASHLEYGETNYIPIQKNQAVHSWVKTVIKVSNISKREMGRKLYNELTKCFCNADGINPSVIVFRLTGFQQIGLTAEQAAKKLDLEALDYHLQFTNTLHYMIQNIKDNNEQFPLLAYLIQGFTENEELTLSARKTWNLLLQGYSPEMIASLRRLRVSTIEDHLVEFALNINHFQIDEYVDNGLQSKILDTSRQQGTKQLKVIKDKVKNASYFQIRLVLAKYGEQSWN
ncbi:helix-turn-helix domain-containing protein [Neobacillus niacini]|uniref:helix-turn-helix domain-containing protein n=1 Tax=Neobacillus niacini TaxID=86668 RepID=UPI0021CB8183|nr:helix-turn-helix domain-containing protein [Neobacillus niacini]MCM3766528.1 helix-turn-helix domain-containing protein [Neobacillus niacini]